ncbi:MAG: glycosyltransferase family 2 protein, partial [Sphingomonadales bacterium]
PGLGAVLGTLRESDPDASIYAWLCDVEWDRPTGTARTFGGIVLLRSAAVRTAGRFSARMIAGEDVDFALRLRAAGWRISVIEAPMAVHDSSLRHFGQWWRRTVRTGHAFAELASLHPEAGFARNCRRILFWAGAVPATILTGIILAAIAGPGWLLLSALAALLVTAQLLRVGLRERRRHGPARAFSLALSLAVGKYAEMIGLLRYGYDQRRGRRPTLIEYKDR